MFFTKLGRIFAWIILVLGVFRVGMGFAIALIDDPLEKAQTTAQLLGSGTIGQAMDQGILAIVVSIALGILAEMGIAIHRK